MRVLVKKRRALPPPRLLSAGAASLSFLMVVGAVVLFAKTPVCTYKRWGASSGDF